MKIYEIGTGYTPIPAQMGAATEIVVEELTRSLRQQGQEVYVVDIACSDRAPTDLPILEVKVPAVFAKKDVSLGILHKLKRVVYSVALAGRLKKLLKASKENVVLHFHNQYNLFFFLKLTSAKLRSKATIAYTVHSYIWHGAWTEIEETVNKRYFQEVECLRRADQVFVLNENTRDTIRDHIGVEEQRIHLIDNGVNTNTYAPLSAEQRAAVKEQYHLADKKVFLQVGSVCDRKNQMESLQLLLPLLKRDTDAVFCYAGGIVSEEYQTALQQYAQQQGVADRVLYLGEVAPGKVLNDIYNLALAMVFPSKLEGFSLVIIEAMAAGLPVFIGNHLQFKLRDRCLIFEDGQEFDNLLEEKILSNPDYDSLSREQREHVQAVYSWDAIAEEYATHFNAELRGSTAWLKS